jgi:hypothetical protein
MSCNLGRWKMEDGGHERYTGGLRQDKTRGTLSFMELSPQHWVDRSASGLPSIFVSVSASPSLC